MPERHLSRMPDVRAEHGPQHFRPAETAVERDWSGRAGNSASKWHAEGLADPDATTASAGRVQGRHAEGRHLRRRDPTHEPAALVPVMVRPAAASSEVGSSGALSLG